MHIEYGYQVIRGWLISGLIFAKCAAKGISVGVARPGDRPPLRATDIDELTQDTISSAIEKFRDGSSSRRSGNQPVHRRRQTLHDLDQAVAAPSTFEPETMAVGHAIVEELLEAMKDDVRAIVVPTAHGYDHVEVAESWV